MPTVLLRDISLSLQRIVPSLGITRQKVLQEGCKYFLSLLQQFQPLEQITVWSFHSKVEMHIELCNDYASLRKFLEQDRVGDKTDLVYALEQISSFIHENEKKAENDPWRVIVITDGRPSDYKGSRLESIKFPHYLSLNIICIGESCDFEDSIFRGLTSKFQGDYYHLSTSELSQQQVNVVFQQLITEHYSLYQARLSCGWMTGWVTLYPNPNNMKTGTDLLHRYMDIIGFMDMASIPCIPSLSSHALIPYTLFTAGEGEAPTSDESLYLCLLLFNTLKDQKMIAIARTSESQHAIITISEIPDSCLIFHFLPENINIPWLGKVDDFRMIKEGTFIDADEYLPSYFSKRGTDFASMPSISNDSLQSDFTKIYRFCNNLPAKHDLLFQELQRLIIVAKIYHLDTVFQTLIELFENVMASSSGETNDILSYYTGMFRDENLFEKSISKFNNEEVNRVKSRMRVNDILN